MKKHIFFVAALLLHINLYTQWIDCTRDSLGYVPLNDLGINFYLGEQGGLYPGGINSMPSGHLNAGKKLSKQVLPLNSVGSIDLENGKVVFVALGSSVGGYTFDSFIETYQSSELINPCMVLANGNYGSRGVDDMLDTIGTYWDFVMNKLLDTFSVTPQQVQIIWLKNISRTDTILDFPFHPQSVSNHFIELQAILKIKFPNLKQVYLTSNHYGGYTSPTNKNFKRLGEPASYYNGFAIKWTIAEQLAGNPLLKYKGPGAKSAWMAWGPYVWADGINPRADGLQWLCSDFDSTGYHLSEEGKTKEATILFNYLISSQTSKEWFKNSAKWNACNPMRTSETINTESGNLFQIYDHTICLNTTLKIVSCHAFTSEGRHLSFSWENEQCITLDAPANTLFILQCVLEDGSVKTYKGLFLQ